MTECHSALFLVFRQLMFAQFGDFNPLLWSLRQYRECVQPASQTLGSLLVIVTAGHFVEGGQLNPCWGLQIWDFHNWEDVSPEQQNSCSFDLQHPLTIFLYLQNQGNFRGCLCEIWPQISRKHLKLMLSCSKQQGAPIFSKELKKLLHKDSYPFQVKQMQTK